MSNSSFVYFMRPQGFPHLVKIGCSTLLQERLKQLAHWSPFTLEIVATIPGSFDLERNIHECFADLYDHHEWFTDDGRIAALIEKLNSGVSIFDAIDLSQRKPLVRRHIKRWSPSEETRKRASYSHRLRHAAKRLGSIEVWYSEPDDVHGIMERWRGRGLPAVILPTERELARLEEVLAAPADHFIPNYRSPKLVAEIRARRAA